MAKTPSDVPVEPGMPQLDFTTFPNQMFWLFVTIVAIYFVLSKIALPRIGAVLSDRQDTIEHDLARAEELKQMAEDAEKAYNKALADARIEAQICKLLNVRKKVNRSSTILRLKLKVVFLMLLTKLQLI